MPVMDEFREEREALKHGTFKQKMSYFFYYYKWHTVGTIVALFFVAFFIYQVLGSRETGFYAVMLNGGDQLNAYEYTKGFAEYAGIDTQKYMLVFDTSIYVGDGNLMTPETIASSDKLTVYAATAELDVMITDSSSAASYANGEYFFDLRDFLNPEQISLYEPYFYYVDWSVVEERLAAADNRDTSYVPVYPDPRNPEEMERPVPVGLYMDNSALFREYYYFLNDELVLFVFANTTHPEAASDFVDFAMELME